MHSVGASTLLRKGGRARTQQEELPGVSVTPEGERAGVRLQGTSQRPGDPVLPEGRRTARGVRAPVLFVSLFTRCRSYFVSQKASQCGGEPSGFGSRSLGLAFDSLPSSLQAGHHVHFSYCFQFHVK